VSEEKDRTHADDAGEEPAFEPMSWFKTREPEGVHRKVESGSSAPVDAGEGEPPPREPSSFEELTLLDETTDVPIDHLQQNDILNDRYRRDSDGFGGSLLDPNEAVSFFDNDLGGDREIDLNLEPALAAPAGPDPGGTPEVVQVRALALALARAVKATRLYPIQNPIVSKFATTLVNTFTAVFGLIPEVRLAVGKTRFFFRNEIVLDQPGREDSVPGRFFWDGIREITFREGLTPQEILDFLSMCRRSQENEETGEDDLVTLFWQKQFEHVSYIAVDDILDLENPDDPVPEEFGSEYVNFIDLDMHNLEDEDNAEESISDMAREIQARLGEAEVDLFGVSHEDRGLIREEMSKDESPKMLEDIFVIIQETLFLDIHEPSFVETVGVMSAALSTLIQDGRIQVATGLVRLMNQVMDEREELSPVMRDAIVQGLTQAWSTEARLFLADHLNAGLVDVVGGLGEFIGILPAEATGAIIEVFAKVENPRGRKAMVDGLTRRARANLDPFLPYLTEPDVSLVRDIIVILGGTLNDKAVRPLKDLMRHPDVEVRCEVLDALVRLGPAKSTDVILAALNDRNPKLRMGAIRALGQAGRMSVPTFIQIVEAPDFENREFTEKKAFFRALATAGGESLTHYFEQFLNQKSFFHRGQNDEVRACACEALGWIGGHKARVILSAVAKDRSAAVRGAAQAALKRLEGFHDDRSAA